MPEGGPPPLRVTVAYSPGAREVLEFSLEVPPRTTVGQALAMSPLADKEFWEKIRHLPVGIWGRPAAHVTCVEDGDRIEICRPLLVDPKQARRERFRKQGARTAGLFANRREGAKAGY
jgi:uncharacterized protein